MFEKIVNLIKNFIKEVVVDIKKFDISSIFTDFRFLTIFILSLVAIIVLLFNMKFSSLITGVVCLAIYYFVFLWRKK